MIYDLNYQKFSVGEMVAPKAESACKPLWKSFAHKVLFLQFNLPRRVVRVQDTPNLSYEKQFVWVAGVESGYYGQALQRIAP